MSFILSALKKSKANEPGSKVLRAEAFDQAIAAHDDYYDTPITHYLKPFILAVLATTIALSIGYITGGGLEVITYKQLNQRLDTAVQLEQPWPEELLKRYYDDEPIAAVQYFDNPKDYNLQLVALKKQRLEAEQQEKLAEQKTQEAKEQARLDARFNQQLEQAIKQQGLVTQAQIKQQEKQWQALQANTAREGQLSINKDELGDVSPELLKAFENAIDDTKDDVDNNAMIIESAQDEYRSKVKPLTQMPSWLQNDIPALHFSLHMYTSDPQSSWIRLNDKDYFAGDVTHEGILIDQILPQLVILEYQGERFSLPALSTW